MGIRRRLMRWHHSPPWQKEQVLQTPHPNQRRVSEIPLFINTPHVLLHSSRSLILRATMTRASLSLPSPHSWPRLAPKTRQTIHQVKSLAMSSRRDCCSVYPQCAAVAAKYTLSPIASEPTAKKWKAVCAASSYLVAAATASASSLLLQTARS